MIHTLSLVGWHPEKNWNVVCILRYSLHVHPCSVQPPHDPPRQFPQNPHGIPNWPNTLVSKNRKEGKNGCCEGDVFYQRPAHFDGSQVVSMSLMLWYALMLCSWYLGVVHIRAVSRSPSTFDCPSIRTAIATQLWAQQRHNRWPDPHVRAIYKPCSNVTNWWGPQGTYTIYYIYKITTVNFVDDLQSAAKVVRNCWSEGCLAKAIRIKH